MGYLQVQYEKILSDYLKNQSEENLYIGQNYIRQLIQKNITPEEVINIHKQAVEQLHGTLPKYVEHAYDFLIEVMVHYGLKVKEHQSLLMKQEELRIEMDIATKIQNLMLKTNIPKLNQIDIGMVSVPVRKMNGDYVYFLQDDGHHVSVAVTDVVGKGVPAALCMSMVKYGLDTLEYANNNPSYVLEVLNRIIEKSVDDSMFVSLFYGRFDVENNIFTYGSAGHEPAFYYNAKESKFYDLESKGLLLGILPEVKYRQSEIHLNDGDFIIMLTDGVTEFRKLEELDSRQLIRDIVMKFKHLNAQQMCDELYKQILCYQNYQLEDDFTVVIMKK
ncbi:sigma-B regulation protein RsbU (phosphoserine phosphatase) [Lysinibacillus composti]|uniref:Phosphoserine phosphatase n=1 Tax=Lysinibacillus composti TaxID=720633 RepID=A0A3N9U4L6_9BACI|nr:PP2C family protein-serine/threonine phosphatase [Lysinibacillus composti]MBM7610555.1 sigma-B regulation protein RsbU (phosphoserine phosphatase) [Lysinibacillus composti]RQW71569.1 phosphoserine phosphatase [Lysinibacillus composti]